MVNGNKAEQDGYALSKTTNVNICWFVGFFMLQGLCKRVNKIEK